MKPGLLIGYLAALFLSSCNEHSGKTATIHDSANRLFKQHYQPDYFKGSYYIDNDADLSFALDTLCLRQVADDARWRIYCSRCDKKVWYSDSVKKACGLPESLTYGELNLVLQKIEKERSQLSPCTTHDHVKIPLPDSIRCNYGVSFAFSYKGSPILQLEDTTHHSSLEATYSRLWYFREFPECPLQSGVDNWRENFYCNWFNKELMDAIKKNGLGSPRVYAPLQPEVISYIRTHADKIDRWFYAEAVKRGVFDTVLYPPATISKQIDENSRRPVSNDQPI